MEQLDHSGQSILVTGGGSGIGAACSKRLAASGARVWVCDVRGEAAEVVAGGIVRDGGRAIPLAGDVARPEGWIDRIEGPLHGIVHAAGYDLPTPVGATDMKGFERILQVMVTGPFDMTQRLLPALSASKGACVVFIASVHALATEPEVSAYAAAKGAQVSMVRSMAQDLGRLRIRTVAISPGYCDTPLLAKFFDSTPDPEATRRRANELHPLGRIGRPEDIASLVAFLLSPQAEFINGTNVVIDGGLTAMLAR